MMTVTDEIGKAFDKHATGYDLAAKVQQEIGRRLFERLSYLKIKPQRILDLGCGTGIFSGELVRKFPQAQIVGLDLAKSMLLEARKKQGWFCKWPLVLADMNCLPFASNTFDLIFANQVVHWGESLPSVFSELNRVMNLNGCLMFTSLGPDTFKELHQAWSDVDQFAHINTFMDMHDVSDCLMREHWCDPVVDMELLAIHYKSLPELLNALKSQGVRNINPKRNKGLTGKASWKQFKENYGVLKTQDGRYPLTYEVLYGHAWKGEIIKRNTSNTETLIPVSQIVRNGTRLG